MVSFSDLLEVMIKKFESVFKEPELVCPENLHPYAYLIARNLEKYIKAIRGYDSVFDDVNFGYIDVMLFYLWAIGMKETGVVTATVSKKEYSIYTEVFTLYLCGFIKLLNEDENKTYFALTNEFMQVICDPWFESLIRSSFEPLQNLKEKAIVNND